MITLRRILYGLLLLFVAFIVVLIFLFAHSAPDKVKAGSISYYIGIPAVIKSVPIYNDCAPVLYSYEGRDGGRSANADIEYGSSLPSVTIVTAYREYFAQLSCHEKHQNSFSCPHYRSYWLRIDSEAETTCKTIHISVTGDIE